MAKLTFLGAARTVTGSKYLLETGKHRILIDCGLFQGLKDLRRRNWAAFPLPPGSLSAVLLTHAHVDHSGLLPRLVANGYRGKIYCTAGTADLCSLVLPDAGHLQEEDARLANRHRFSRHTPALPLFTEADARRVLEQLDVVPYGARTEVVPGTFAEFMNAGHLLGSAFIRVSRQADGPRLLFGGDLGRYRRPVLPDPSAAPDADTLLLESTYGNRAHPANDDGAVIERVVNETAARGGRVIIPAFAIGRTEELLYWLKRLEDAKRIPALPVYLDSPMAVQALNFYAEHEHELDREVRGHDGSTRAYNTKRFRAVSSPEESKAIVAAGGPGIVISASGMATGGRVLHHLVACLPDERNTVLFVGFQAPGTRGQALLDGAKAVKIHGQMIPVRASIVGLDSMSAHADVNEILRWLATFKSAPRQVYLVHGEPAAQDALAATIQSSLGWRVHIPQHGEAVEVPL